MYSASQVAEHFIERADQDGQTITAAKLQKLLYFAQGWHLGLYEDLLFPDPIQAWQYGPVTPSVYFEYRRFGADPLVSEDSYAFDEFDEATALFLEKVWEVYGRFTASQLISLTHEPDTPWSKAHRAGSKQPIRRELLEDHFRAKAAG